MWEKFKFWARRHRKLPQKHRNCHVDSGNYHKIVNIPLHFAKCAFCGSYETALCPGGGGGTQIWFRRGCAAEAAKPVPIFKGHFGGKGYPLWGGFYSRKWRFLCTLATKMGENIYSKIIKLHPMFRDFSAKLYPMFRDFFFLRKKSPISAAHPRIPY